MKVVMHNRRESFFYSVNHDNNYHLDPKDRFFQPERSCQYAPTVPSYFSLDTCRALINQLIWKRLALIRINHVLLSLMNLTDNRALGALLNSISSILIVFGWALHGHRLLINTFEFVQRIMFEEWIGDIETKLVGYGSVEAHMCKQGITLTNDLMWVLVTNAPSNVLFTSAFLWVDLVWVSGRAWCEMSRLQDLCKEVDGVTNHPMFNEQMNELVHERKKFILNLASLISLSAITLLKNVVLPILFHALAVNPALLLACNLLSLTITILSPLFSGTLAEPTVCVRYESEHLRVASVKSRQPIFCDLPSLNDSNFFSPICA